MSRTPETATGRVFVRDRNYKGAGDGDLCPSGHGRMFILDRGQWCPDQSHEKGHPKSVTGYTGDKSLEADDLGDIDIGGLNA